MTQIIELFLNNSAQAECRRQVGTPSLYRVLQDKALLHGEMLDRSAKSLRFDLSRPPSAGGDASAIAITRARVAERGPLSARLSGAREHTQAVRETAHV